MKFERLEILDTISNNVITYDAVDYDSIVLRYPGGDDKLPEIVGSELVFTLIDKQGVDGRYQYLIDDEYRYQVRIIVYKGTNEVVYWKGWLIHQEYVEPVDSMNRSVQFTAVDGLVLLKYKRLKNYNRYVKLKDLFRELLNMTGRELLIAFAPAFDNSTVAWKDVMIDLRKFVDKTTYDILKEIVVGAGCMLYYEQDVWKIVGYNQRYGNEIKYYIIDLQGNVFYNSETIFYNDYDFLPEPNVRKLEPVKNVRVGLGWKKNVIKNLDTYDYRYINRGYLRINPPKWWVSGYSDVSVIYFINANNSGHHYIYNQQVNFNENEYLFYNFYVKAGTKIKIKATINLLNWQSGVVFDENKFRYKFKINDEVLQANFDTSEGYVANEIDKGQTIKYKDSVATIDYEVIVGKSGYFQMFLFFFQGQFNIGKYNVNVEYKQDDVVIENMSYGYELEKKLDVFPDVRHISKSFILEDITQYNIHQNRDVTIYYRKVEGGKNLLFINIVDAEFIKRYIDNITWNGNKVEVLELIYNWYGGEGIAVVTDDMSIDETHPLVVDVHNYHNVASERKYYDEWQDRYYGVGKYNYQWLYADMLKRLFSDQYTYIDGGFNSLISYGEHIRFNYLGKRIFIPTNIELNLLRGETTGIFHEVAYTVDSVTAQSPYLYAESPIYIEQTDNTAVLNCDAGFVGNTLDSVQWIKLIGSGGDIDHPNDLNTGISNVTDDYYKYKVTVINSDGKKSFAIVEVVRKKSLNVSLNEISSSSPSDCIYDWEYEMVLDDELQDDDLFLLDIELHLDGLSYVNLYKNNMMIASSNVLDMFPTVRISYQKGDRVTVKMRHYDCCDDYGGCRNWDFSGRFRILRSIVLRGINNIANIPYEFIKNH